MRKLVNLAISYPITIIMVVLAILLLGKISYDRLGVDLLPSLDSPKLYIELVTNEKPPTEVEKQLVKDIEGLAIRTRDAKEVMSKVRNGGALITVEYQWGKDMNEAFLDLQRAVAAVGQNVDVKEVNVSQRDPSSKPIMLVTLSHPEMTLSDLTRTASNYMRPQLLSVEGIADVDFNGEQEVEIVVESDPYKLAAYSLTVNDISQKIKDNNYRIAGGKIEEMGVRYIVSGSNLLKTVEEFNSIIVGYKNVSAADAGVNPNPGSAINNDDRKGAVYLGDVANIYVSDKDLLSVVQLNGNPCIGVELYKERGFNTLKATMAVNTKLEELRKSLSHYNIEVVSNQGEFIDRSINDVKDSALLGMFLAIVVLFVFLRKIGTTFVVSLAIPISIVATFNLLYFGGLTLNIMTLGGLALGAGMLVDNAIVVIESIFRNHEKGLSLKEAIVEGTGEVGGAIIASTLTTIVVFLPIVYLQGQSGALFKEQAWSVTFSLLSSLFVAIFAIPVLYSKLLGSKKKKVEKESLKITGYGNLLGHILNYRWIVVMLSVMFVAGVFMLTPLIGSEFMPQSTSKNVNLDLELTGGTTLARTSSTVNSIEGIISEICGDSVLIYSHCGVSGSDGGRTPLNNRAQIKVIIDNNSDVNAKIVSQRLQPYLNSILGLKATFSDSEGAVSSLLEQDDADIVVEISGSEIPELSRITNDVISSMEGIEGVTSVSHNNNNNDKEIVISVDRVMSSIYGVNMQNIISDLQQQISGLEAGEMEMLGELCEINVKLPSVSVNDLSNLVITAGDKRIVLGEVATIKVQDAPNQILRRGQNRIMQVSLYCDTDEPLSIVSDRIKTALAQIDTPADYHVNIEGSEQKRAESLDSLLFALMLSVILVYMVMASQFESLLHPFTILLTIPLAVAGALLLFLITGKTLNIMAAIGIVMLVGIAVNNSILLVDRIGQLIKGGMELRESIIYAAEQRVRPILMTSLTTILALLPMAFAFGDGAEFQSPMAIAVIGGLTTSTLLSLVVIPCVYYIFESIKRSLFGKSKIEQL